MNSEGISFICLICNEYGSKPTSEEFDRECLWNDKDTWGEPVHAECKQICIDAGIDPKRFLYSIERYPNCIHPEEELRDCGDYYQCKKCGKLINRARNLDNTLDRWIK